MDPPRATLTPGDAPGAHSSRAVTFAPTARPFTFKLGAGDVIQGWDIGVADMKIGEKRRLTIPAAAGYGTRGAPPDIPGGATLVFDVELKNVR